MTDIAMIRAAEQRLKGVVRETPILNSPILDEIAGRKLLVKAECLQHTGSFKFRGGWSAVSALPADVRKRGVLAYSSGNHAQGVALAAQKHDCPAVIIMPADAPAMKIENTRGFGAEVVLYDRVNGENREEIGTNLSKDRALTLIKPYDNAQVIAGQGTCGLEIARQVDGPADVLVNCGGGGLSSGIALALEAEAPGLRVRPVEPLGFDDVKQSLEQGERVENPSLSGSICDAILTPSPGQLTFPILKRLAGPGIAVSDEDCLRAIALAWLHLKIVVEPGGIASLAAALFHRDELSGDSVVIVATGGNVSPAVFAKALSTLN